MQPTGRARQSETPEDALLLWAGGLLNDPVAVPDWPSDTAGESHIREFLRRHGIDRCLKDRALKQESKPPGFLMTDSEYYRVIGTEIAREEEFAGIIELLNNTSAPRPIIFKGQALAHTVYSSPWLRPRGDIDAIIPKAALDETVKAFGSVGYRQSSSIDGDLVMPQTMLWKRSGRIAHAWDIHWSVNNRPAYSRDIDYEVLLRSARTTSVSGSGFLIPGRADSLALACLHLIGHHREQFRLIWLYDIVLLVNSFTEADLREFMECVQRNRNILSACYTAIGLTARYLPDIKTLQLKSDLESRGAREAPVRTYARQIIGDIGALKRKHRISFVKQHLFPSADYMVKRFTIKRRWLLPFWYAIRIGRALPKALKKR